MGEEFKYQELPESFNRRIETLLNQGETKDRIITALDNFEPEQARELVKVLLWSDSAFSFGLLGQLPRGLNFFVAFLDELGQQLQNVPPDLMRQFVAEMGHNIDHNRIAALPATYAPLVKAILTDPEADLGNLQLKRELKIRKIEKKLHSTDFGKVRHTISKQLEEQFPLLESTVATAIGDPIIFANLINILPPLINHLLKGTAGALRQVDYPPEILASALFNLLKDIELKELSTIINNLNRLIADIHQGSAILGGNEPRFRSVLHNFLEQLLDNLDGEAAASALIALGEDLETGFSLAADLAIQKPELAAELFNALLKGSSATLGGLTALIDRLNELPPPYFARFTDAFTDSEMPGRAGLINSLIALSNRILNENPALFTHGADFLLREIDRSELQMLLRNILSQAKAAGNSCHELLQHLPSEETEQALNSLLNLYNRSIEKRPERASNTLSPFLSGLDQEQLARAILLTSTRLADNLSENPLLSRSLFKALWKIFRGALKGTVKRVEKRNEGRG